MYWNTDEWYEKADRLEELLEDQGWLGTDTNPGISLLEYGFVLKENESGDWDAIVEIRTAMHEPPEFKFTTLKREAFRWACDHYGSLMAEKGGESLEEWRDLWFAHQIYDLWRDGYLLNVGFAGALTVDELIEKLEGDSDE